MVLKSTLALLFAIVAVGCMVIAFASPYWIESFAKSNNLFVKCGLWEFCFNDYTFYKDYNAKRYLGCWYIFTDEVRPIWEWLSPPWFISVQVMVSGTLLFEGIIGIVLIFGFLRCFPKYLEEMIFLGLSAASFFVVFIQFIVLVLFGIKKEDRDWVPRPDQNYLSWSYGFYCIGTIATLIGGYLLFKASREARDYRTPDYPDKPRY